MHFGLTFDVLAFLLTSSEFSASAPFFLLHDHTFTEPIKTHTQGKDISCDLNTMPTHNCLICYHVDQTTTLEDQTLLCIVNVRGQREREKIRSGGTTIDIW
jgi:hypothetical protein